MTGFNAYPAYIGLILTACSVLTYIYSGRVIRNNDSLLKVLIYYLLITILAAVSARFFHQTGHGAKTALALLKFAASLPTVLFALKGYLIRPTRFGRCIVLAIGIGLVADIVINMNPAIGGVVFLAGHLLYDFAFLSEKKPSRRQIMLWIALSALLIIPLYVFRAQIGSSLYCIGGWLYLTVLISTVVFSWSLRKIVFAAALVFAFSDCFMIANVFGHGTMLMKIMALEVYYCSLFLYGAVLWKRNYHPARPLLPLIEKR
ncbi:MAG: hypothetical protein IJH43_09105 [Mogibacterium sp.]|nr:hypothetical protein [Mogibacterium sp.]